MKKNSNAVIVLGSGLAINKEGVVIPNMNSRMRALAAFYFFVDNSCDKIVVCGGHEKGNKDQTIARAIQKYLLAKGISRGKVLIETRSKNTSESFLNILDLIRDFNFTSIFVVTNNYHIKRSRIILKSILRKHKIKLTVVFFSAEKILNGVSPRYRMITSYYLFPTSLFKTPMKVLKIGLREFLKRCTFFVDRNNICRQF